MDKEIERRRTLTRKQIQLAARLGADGHCCWIEGDLIDNWEETGLFRVKELLWFSYRKNFPPIPPDRRYQSDAGWGCMYRSMQMLLGNAFRRHVGISHAPGPAGLRRPALSVEEAIEKELLILSWFFDVEECPFSIHRFSQLCDVFGHRVGEWVGPTVASHAAEVLVNSQDLPGCHVPCAIYVAQDGTLFVDELWSRTRSGNRSSSREQKDELHVHPPVYGENASSSSAVISKTISVSEGSSGSPSDAVSPAVQEPPFPSPVEESLEEADKWPPQNCLPGVLDALQSGGVELSEDESESSWELIEVSGDVVHSESCGDGKDPLPEAEDEEFTPILILIPLRLGVGATINPIYIDALLRCFHFPSLIGIAGGKPRSSYYFYGCQATSLLYMDPHTVQVSCNPQKSMESYHTNHVTMINVERISPSLSMGFYCHTAEELQLFLDMASCTVALEEPPLFTIMNTRPNFGCFGDHRTEL